MPFEKRCRAIRWNFCLPVARLEVNDVTPRLMGIETEYALAVAGAQDGFVDHELVANQLMTVARKNLVHLRDGGSGIFLANGSRLYIDCSLHPELATPECSTPCEVVRYVEAGHAILGSLVSEVRVRNP